MPPPHLKPWSAAGETIFVSGQLPFDASRNLVGTEIADQTRQALANLEAVLRDATLDLSDVVKTTVWLRRAEDFAGFNEAYAEVFGDRRPARSAVVSELVVPGALVEIEAIAVRRSA